MTSKSIQERQAGNAVGKLRSISIHGLSRYLLTALLACTVVALFVPGAFAAPVTAERQDDLGDGDHMKTQAFLAGSGRLDATTRTWTNEECCGFTGHVQIVVRDGQGNPLGVTQREQFGVDGKWVPFKKSDRTDHWTAELGSEAGQRAASLSIYHTNTPVDRFGAIINEVLNKGCMVIMAIPADLASKSAELSNARTECDRRRPLNNTAKPTISGPAREGDSLTCQPGSWSPEPSSRRYEFLRDGNVVEGDNTYSPTAADVGKSLTCRESVSRFDQSNSATSDPVKVSPVPLVNQSRPRIVGTPRVGRRLTCSPGSWSPTPITRRYQFLRGGVVVGNARTYLVKHADRGRRLQCRESVGRLGQSAAATSNSVLVRR